MSSNMINVRSRLKSDSMNDFDMNADEIEPNCDDPEDFIDDITDEELLGDFLKKKPKSTDDIGNVIVVDNVPEVGADKQEKLKNIIMKLFSKFGKVVNVYYAVNGEGVTSGFVFVEFSSPQIADEAIKMINGYKLDKLHTFAVNHFSDIWHHRNLSDKWVIPEPKKYVNRGNLKSWLLNKDCYDQFSVIYEGGNKVSILLNSPEPTKIEERQMWTETYVRWSPQGTCLATFHTKGIALWAGDEFSQLQRFQHNGVQLIDFSPCERYLITFSPSADSQDDPQAIVIWDLRSGAKMRSFHCSYQTTWPIFKWNHDGSYFARIGHDRISVYETLSFGLLDKNSIKISSVKDFSWSPSDNVIACWVPEEANTPARAMLIEIPSRRELCVRNIFHVADCKLYWQRNGDHLCVKVDRYSKAKKADEKDQMKYSGIYYSFEIFRMREKHIPVDQLEIKEPVLAFAWEPVSNKFAVIHGDSPRISVSFYAIQPKGKVEALKTFEKRQANHLFWGPNGQFIILAGLHSMNGVLEFIDTQDMTVMAQTEHFMATDVEWDPTGRYVSSAVSWWGHKVDNGYWLWSFQGQLLNKLPMERFCQLLWRPRPPSLISDKQVKELRKTLKNWSQKFEMEDAMRKMTASKELIEKRQMLMHNFNIMRAKKEKTYLATKDLRLRLRGGVSQDQLRDQEDDTEEERIEFLVKVEETIEE